MPGAARLNDRCTGHGCFPPRSNIEASTDVFTNDLGAHRQGDSWKHHSCILSHGGNLANGCPDVFINDKQAGRIGDRVNCGSHVQTGSTDVFIGD
jgi:uncharacterized Zn-binding protein involved in type VI secretion